MEHRADIKRLARQLRQIRSLQKKKEYTALLAKINDLLKISPYSVPLLVLKAQVLQLIENDKPPRSRLKEARESLMLALEVDPKAASALNELAFYLFAVEDQGSKALSLFERSIRASLQNLKEAHMGRIQCLLDLRRWADCERFLAEARKMLGDSPEIAELEEVLNARKQARKRG